MTGPHLSQDYVSRAGAGRGTLSGSARIWTHDDRLIASGGGQCLIVPLKG
jgi:hypothetical protein